MSTASTAASWAKSSGLAIISVVPRIVGRGLVGGLLGGFGMSLLGAVLAATAAWFWKSQPAEKPSWLYASLWLTPVVLGVAGTVVGAVRGALGGLAQALVEKKLVAWIYAQVKPAGASVVSRLRGHVPASAGEVAKQLEQQLSDEAPVADSSAGRFAQWLATKSRRVLALSVVAHVARAKSGAEAVAELEKLGIERLEQVMVESLEDLFSLKLMLVSGAALLACLLPQLIFWFTR